MAWTITLEGADDATFTTNAVEGTYSVLGVTGWRTGYTEPGISFGHVSAQATEWVREVVVAFDRFKTETDATGDSGDLLALETILFKKHLRITDVTTTRTDGTTNGEYWPPIIGDGYPVVLVGGWPPSADMPGGADTVTLTLRSVYPGV